MSLFGNGPAVATISRADIEGALAARGYTKGAYRDVVTPKYSKTQAITQSVDKILQGHALSTRPPTRMTLEPAKWTKIVDDALYMASALARMVVKTRELVGIAARGF